MSPDVESDNGKTVLKRVSSSALNQYLSTRRLTDGITHGLQIYVGTPLVYVLPPSNGETYSLDGFKFYLGESRFVQRALFPEALQWLMNSQDTRRRGGNNGAEDDIRLILGLSGLLDYMEQRGYNAVTITSDCIVSSSYPQLKVNVTLGHVVR